MVQPNGIGELPGTLFSADRLCTSWKVTPANSGVRTVRTKPDSRPMPGRADRSSTPSDRPSHLMSVIRTYVRSVCKVVGRGTPPSRLCRPAAHLPPHQFAGVVNGPRRPERSGHDRRLCGISRWAPSADGGDGADLGC